MNFEVNGQAYVLTFLAEEGSFALFAPQDHGIKRMKIVHDDGPMVIAQFGESGPEKPKNLN